MSNAFLVPQWLVGTERDVLRALPAVAKKWAASYKTNDVFPSIELVDPGKIDIILSNDADCAPLVSAVRLFLNMEFIWKVKDAIQHVDREQLITDYETHVGAVPWGGLETIMLWRSPATLPIVERRYRQLLPHLNTLEHCEVVTVLRRRITALEFVDQAIGRTLENWGVPVEGALTDRIQRALDVMSHATRAEIDTRIVQRIIELAPTMDRIRRPERFTAESVRRWVSSLDPSEYHDLTGCHEASLRSIVYAMDRDPNA